jgi:hypothetical protein
MPTSAKKLNARPWAFVIVRLAVASAGKASSAPPVSTVSYSNCKTGSSERVLNNGCFLTVCLDAVDCPMDLERNRCSGHGQCLSLRQLAQYTQAANGTPLDVEYGVDEVRDFTT